MPQYTLSKNRIVAQSISYGAWVALNFAPITLSGSPSLTGATGLLAIPFNFKIFAVSVTTTGAVTGLTNLQLNIAAGTANINGVGVTDQTPLGITPTATAVNGNQLFAVSPSIFTTATTFGAVSNLLPVPGVDGFDMIFPPNLPLTLRLGATGSATGGQIVVSVYGVPYDINVTKPEIGPFPATTGTSTY